MADELHALAVDGGFSGVVLVDVDGAPVLERAYGLADRAHGIPVQLDTRIGVASATKGFTALTVMSLIEDGVLSLSTTARALLGDDLPLIDDAVTVEHLLSHRSGIGDYLDEDTLGDINDHIMTEPVHRLGETSGFLPALAGHPMRDVPGAVFRYNNGGFLVLALLAERASGIGFHELVEERVCAPAGLASTAFLRSDELPGDAAIGYLFADGLRTNLLHLPVRGNGDGGIYTTAADVRTLWSALFAGRIVPLPTVAEMVRPRSTSADSPWRYGLGFWLHPTSEAVMLEGYDAGASFRSLHHPGTRTAYAVLSNTSEGAWPLVERLHASIAPS